MKDSWEYWFNLRHTLNRMYLTNSFQVQYILIRLHNDDNDVVWCANRRIPPSSQNILDYLRISTGGNRTKLPSSRWRRRGRSLREVFACLCFLATTDLSQIYNRDTRRHESPCTKTTDSYLFSLLYNDPRKIRRETTVGKFVPNNGRR